MKWRGILIGIVGVCAVVGVVLVGILAVRGILSSVQAQGAARGVVVFAMLLVGLICWRRRRV